MKASDPFINLREVALPFSLFARPEFHDAMNLLGHCLRGMLVEIRADSNPWSARGLASRLQIDKSLAWAMLRIAHPPSLEAAAAALPGDRGWSTLLASARRSGIAQARLESLSSAVAHVTSCISDHGFDREALRLAASGGLPPSSGVVDDAASGGSPHHLRLRRRFFEAARLIWGVSATGSVNTIALAPARFAGEPVRIGVQRFIRDINRQRCGNPWPIYAEHRVRGPAPDSDGSLARLGASVVTESARSPDQSEVRVSVRELASAPRHTIPVHEFLQRNPARTEPLDLLFREYFEGGASQDPPILGFDLEPEYCNLTLECSIPKRIAVVDVLVHRSIQASPTCLWHTAVDKVAGTIPVEHGWQMFGSPSPPLVLTGPIPVLPGALKAASKFVRSQCDALLGHLGIRTDEMILHRFVTQFPPVPLTLEVESSLHHYRSGSGRKASKPDKVASVETVASQSRPRRNAATTKTRSS